MTEDPTQDVDRFAAARAALVGSLRRDISDARVLDAITRVPRERFVAPELVGRAYDDQPLSIGHGQTTSQPRMIALMLQELRLQPGDRVLEVGAGCGYQTALLAELAAEVVAVELVPALAESAQRALDTLGYTNVVLHLAGEALGWPADAPYDAIVVAAASPRIPQSLTDQLAPGGRLVIPVGPAESQELMLVERVTQGLNVSRRGACRFVPLIGKEANPASKS